MKRDTAIDTLLDLNGSILDQGNGYWIKLEAWRVEVSDQIPHGIRYALTLHEPYGNRILGYDNAHAVKPPKKVYATMMSRNTNMAILGETSGNRVVNTDVPATKAEAT